MKKVISFMLVVMLLVSIAPTAFAANATANTTTLTTNVPDAIYTLNIPADQEIEYGEITTGIGNVTITNAKYFAAGKNLEVTVAYGPFASEEVNTTIPFKLVKYAWGSKYRISLDVMDNDVLVFKGLSSEAETCINKYSGIPTTNTMGDDIFMDMEGIELVVNSTDWGKALAGDYKAAITFTAAVVVEE